MRARLMIAGLSAVAGLCLWMLATAVPASAHHAFAAEFDADRPVEFSGTVTKVEWINPHVWIHIDVNTDAGATENWAFEEALRDGLSCQESMSWSMGIRRRMARTERTVVTLPCPTAPSYFSDRPAPALRGNSRDPEWTLQTRVGNRRRGGGRALD